MVLNSVSLEKLAVSGAFVGFLTISSASFFKDPEVSNYIVNSGVFTIAISNALYGVNYLRNYSKDSNREVKNLIKY